MRKKKRSAEQHIITGIVGLSVTAAVSLYASFRPFPLPDISGAAGLLVSAAKTGFASPAPSGPGLADSACASPSEPEAGNPDAQSPAADNPAVESPVQPGRVGQIPDLNTEFSDQSADDGSYTVMLDTAMGPMLYYNQGDPRWAAYLYAGEDPMGKYGCGPTAVAMLANSFGNTAVTPSGAADWASQSGFHASGSGSYHSLIPEGLAHYGLSAESVPDPEPNQVRQVLEEGRVLVALMGRGRLTDNGHFIIITGFTSDGYLTIADPNSLANSTAKWDPGELLEELKPCHDSGGPLWAVGYPQ